MWYDWICRDEEGNILVRGEYGVAAAMARKHSTEVGPAKIEDPYANRVYYWCGGVEVGSVGD